MIRKTISLCALLFAGAVSAQTKISGLTALAAAPASGDLVAIVDVSDTTQAATGTTKKITASNLFLFRFPASSTDNAISRYDGTSGTLQDSGITVADVTGSSVTVATTAGNALAMAATAPAAANGASQAGKSVSVTASAAIASLDTAGAAAGGAVTITSGAAARNSSGNADGGDITLVGGAGIGTGTAGQVLVPAGVAAAPGIAGSVDPDTGVVMTTGGMNHYVNGLGIVGVGGAGLTALQPNALDISTFRHIALLYGNIQQSAPSGGAEALRGQVTEAITLSTSGTTTDSTANLLPAGALILNVSCRVTTTITTATDWSIGDSTTAARFASANATMTSGATSIGLNQWQGSVSTDAAGPVQSAAAKLRITTTGTPGAGALRCTVFYIQFTAPIA